MRRMRTAGTVLAGACAAALTVSLAACTPVSKSAGAPSATMFPSAGTAPARALGSGHAAGSNRADRGSVRAATLSRSALADPDAIAATDTDVWVANSDYESGGRGWVSEFSAASGALVRVIASPHDGLTDPQALAVGADHVWVADGDGGGLTELNAATGALIRLISKPEYHLSGPDAIAAAGDDVWVVDVDSGSVTEVNADTGALIRVISPVANVPFAIAADRAGVWLMTNLGVKAVDGARPDGAVDEFSAATGRPITRIAGPPFRSDNPGGAIAAAGARIWATDTNFYSYRGWVAELSARTGGLVRVIGARSGHPQRS